MINELFLIPSAALNFPRFPSHPQTIFTNDNIANTFKKALSLCTCHF